MLIISVMVSTLAVGAVEETQTEVQPPVEPEIYYVQQDVTVKADQVTILDANGDENVLYSNSNPTQGVGTSNVSIFERVAQKLPYGTHYVYWREGQYEYRLAYSDSMTWNGSRFHADSATVISYTTTSGYDATQRWDEWTENDLNVYPSDLLVYSDLGNYPTLYERGEVDYAKTACIILCSFALWHLFSNLRNALRRRFF